MADHQQSEHDLLLFIEVPSPGSGNVVEALRGMRSVASAAAVYAEIDVIAHLHGTRRRLDRDIKSIKDSGAPITNIEMFEVDHLYRGPRYQDRSIRLATSCRAFLRCETGLSGNSRRFAANALANLECVAAVYENHKSTELIVEVVAADKMDLDAAVMAKVQGEWKIVRSTRSYVVINNRMSWSRWLPEGAPDIFISFSTRDESTVMRMKDRLERDTGLQVWCSMGAMHVGAPSWPKSIDEAVSLAPLHLYLLGDSSRESKECDREFGMSLATVSQPENICIFVLPGCNFDAFGVRYRVRNCLFADRIFAYPELLEWIRTQLRANAAGRGPKH